MVYAALPLIVGAATLLSCAGVPLAAGFNVVPDHCHINVESRICTPHEPVAISQVPFGLVAFSALALVIAAGIVIGWRLWANSRLCRNLRLCSAYSADLGAWVVETDSALAFCAGILRRRVYVSAGMVRKLSAPYTERISGR